MRDVEESDAAYDASELVRVLAPKAKHVADLWRGQFTVAVLDASVCSDEKRTAIVGDGDAPRVRCRIGRDRCERTVVPLLVVQRHLEHVFFVHGSPT